MKVPPNSSLSKHCNAVLLKPDCTRVFKSKTKTLFCLQPQLASLCAASSRGRPTSCHRPPPQQESIPQQETEDSELHIHPQPQENPQLSGIGAPPAARSGEDGSRSSTDSPSVGSIGDPGETTSTTILFHGKMQNLLIHVHVILYVTESGFAVNMSARVL